MPADPGGQGDQCRAHPRVFEERKSAVQERGPDQGDGYDLGPHRDGLVLPEIPDIGAQVFVMGEPVVHPGRAFHPQGGRKQQERGGGE